MIACGGAAARDLSPTAAREARIGALGAATKAPLAVAAKTRRRAAVSERIGEVSPWVGRVCDNSRSQLLQPTNRNFYRLNRAKRGGRAELKVRTGELLRKTLRKMARHTQAPRDRRRELVFLRVVACPCAARSPRAAATRVPSPHPHMRVSQHVRVVPPNQPFGEHAAEG